MRLRRHGKPRPDSRHLLCPGTSNDMNLDSAAVSYSVFTFMNLPRAFVMGLGSPCRFRAGWHPMLLGAWVMTPQGWYREERFSATAAGDAKIKA